MASSTTLEQDYPDNCEDREKRIRGLVGLLTAFVCISLFYILTLAPDLVWQDQGDYQYQVAKLNLNRPGDVVRVHPLYIITAHYLGRLGLFSYAYAANLVSAVFTAVTAASIYLLVFWLTRRIWPAVLSTLTFAMAHSVWFLGVQAQTYSMANAALMGAVLLTVAYVETNRTRYLFWMGLIFGLGISAHIMSQIGFAVIMVWLFVRCLRGKTSLAAFLMTIWCWAVGAFLLWVAAVIEYNRSGDILATAISALWGKWGDAVFNVGKVPLLLRRSLLFLVLNFPTPLVLLTIPGVYRSFRGLGNGTTARLLLICTCSYALFAARYDVPNQNNFFLPTYMFVSVYIGLGFAFLFKSHVKIWAIVSAFLVLAIPPTYFAISECARLRKVELGTRRHIPYRDVYRYYLLPWQQNQVGPRRFATELFRKLPEKAIILSDSTSIPPLLYMHDIEGARPDVTVLTTSVSVEELQGFLRKERRIFTISDVRGYRPPWVEEKTWLKPFAISPTEQVFEIIVPKTDSI
ncbi:MAG: protein O-mannosyl-transferase family [Planctomycetota bacterium]